MLNFLKPKKSYFMLQEILEQKDVFAALVSKFFDKELNINIDDFPVQKWDKITICASGSSKNAAEIAKYFIEDIAEIPCSIEYASEFAHKKNLLKQGDLFIAISQSGNTADTFEALLKAKKAGAKTFGITNAIDSKIHTNADHKILADAGIERSIAATKSFTAQLLILYVFAMKLAEDVLGKDVQALKKEFVGLSKKYDDIYAQRDNIKKIAKRVKKAKSLAILGRNYNAALTLEGSLKTKETCYINAMPSPAGEFMHGHFAVLDNTIPIIGMLNKAKGDEENYKLALNNLSEIKSKRKTTLILLKTASDNIDKAKLSYEYSVEIPKVSIEFAPFLNLVALQMIAFETACLLNDNVDEPRDLQKCVASE